ncbi:MAG: energy transducer TonB [Alphaproteobacteria bacterium]
MPTMVRQLISAGVAVVVTFGLFWGMQKLIAIGSGGKTEVAPTASIEFVRVKRDETVNDKQRKLQRPDKVDTPPPPPPMSAAKSKPTNNNLEGGMPDLGENVAMAGGTDLSGGSDGDIMPMVRVAPQYPRRALSRGIEGWVEVEFTISKVGTVENAVVNDADPPSIFNRAALKAVSKWKYKPKIDDGVAVERHGVRVVLTFELDK